MFSLVNNIEEFYSINNPNNIVLYNLNHNYIQSKIFDNYNTAYSACNYYIIDFLISFFFDIEKRRNSFIKNIQNQEKQKEDNNENKNLIIEADEDIALKNIGLSDDFLSDFILIIIEIITELPKEEIIDYFLFQNNIISLKLKIFFYRNIYLFNENNEFIQKLLQIIQMERKYSQPVEENTKKNNEKFFLVFMSEIFLDLLFFRKLNFFTQNYILMILIKNVAQIDYKIQESMCEIAFKLLKQIYNIFLYNELSLEEITYNIGEEKFSTQIDLIIKSIDSIFVLFEMSDNKSYINKIIEINNYIINLHSNYKTYIQNI